MSRAAADRLLSGRAWDDFCEQVRQAGHEVAQFKDASPLEIAEWYRFMTRLMRNGFERYVENCEPEHPRIRDATWRTAINFQSPDQDHYLSEFVDGRHRYRIRGNRGGVPYFVMAAWTARQPADLGERDWAPQGSAGLEQFDPSGLRTTGMLQSQDIDFDASGDFEVLVSQEPPADRRNWLPITADCVGLLVRVVHHRREQEAEPRFTIERIDQPAQQPLSPELLSANLAKAAQWTRAYAALVGRWWHQALGLRPNRLRFSQKMYLSNGGVADRHHGFGSWQLLQDQALVLEFTPPACDYWIFQLCNIWQENLDNYEHGQGYVTKYRAEHEADGRVRIIIAARNPGIGGNWIDPMGHQRGGWSLRVILTSSPPPSISLHCLPLSALEREGLKALEASLPVTTGEWVE